MKIRHKNLSARNQSTVMKMNKHSTGLSVDLIELRKKINKFEVS